MHSFTHSFLESEVLVTVLSHPCLQTSVFEDVVEWCEEITVLLEKEISVSSVCV